MQQLSRGAEASARVVAVVAHPDDETLGAGGALSLMLDVLVVQVTDGASGNPAQWSSAGLATREAYAALRGSEREAAWRAAGWSLGFRECGIIDQCAHDHLAEIVDVLALALEGAHVVMTHPYEGGHPDHDACAFVVQAACDRRAAAGLSVPDRMEFASYHWNGARRVAGVFWPHPGTREWVLSVSGEPLARKRAAIAEYRSQGSVTRWFDPTVERYRAAPRYDFSQPPPPPGCLYERKGWPLTNAALRAAMARCA